MLLSTPCKPNALKHSLEESRPGLALLPTQEAASLGIIAAGVKCFCSASILGRGWAAGSHLGWTQWYLWDRVLGRAFLSKAATFSWFSKCLSSSGSHRNLVDKPSNRWVCDSEGFFEKWEQVVPNSSSVLGAQDNQNFPSYLWTIL